MSNGFFTIAQGDNYVRMAYALQLSLLNSQLTHKGLTIGVAEDQVIPDKYVEVFDNIVIFPWKDHAAESNWKLENEWKAIYMTPYDHTIKLDADMLFFKDISHWWNVLEASECVFTTDVLNYRNNIAIDQTYRQTFVDNDLPNVYTALFYFQKTSNTFELFKLAEDIFNNWEQYFDKFLIAKSRPKFVSTDVVFALAAKILGTIELNIHPHIQIPNFVHMKTRLQEWDKTVTDEDWTQYVPQYFTTDGQCKIGNYAQTAPFHYHVKHFITDEMIEMLEKRLGI